jgi:molybdopterin-guanine dinucleotide biosynthesis protein A
MRARGIEPIGVVLAGGRGSRLGGDKATALLAGRPLISHPLAAMRHALTDVAVVAKRDTALPGPDRLHGAAVWIEPDEPRHPLTGILYALERAGGRAIVVCAADLPFVSAPALVELAFGDAGGAPALLARSTRGAVQPLLGRYEARAAALLASAAIGAGAPLRETVLAIGPALVGFDDPELLFNVNSPDDLRRAEEIAGGYPKVKS